MGMFNDNICPRRLDWEYPYTGKELIDKARMLQAKHAALETAARNKTADLLRDDKVSQNDSRFNELKRDITTHGTIKEQCEVFAHQFAREPERVFSLGLGDVTFFELTTR
jgi:hypothetical protein